MTNYEAIGNLMPKQLEKFLDQVFLTGFNSGYQSLVDPDIFDDNPFDADWINSSIGESRSLVENENGEDLIIEPLVRIVSRIAEFDADSISESISWEPRLVLPKGVQEAEEE